MAQATRRRRSAESNTLWVVTAVGALLFAVFAGAAWQFSQVQSSFERQIAVVNAAFAQHDRLLQIVNEETGVRGYIATGDPRYLDVYYASKGQLQRDERIVSKTVLPQDAPTRRAEANVQSHFERQIALVDANRIAQARGSLKRGKFLVDRLRDVNSTSERAAAREVASQRARTRWLARAGLCASVVLCIGVILWIAVFALVLRRTKRYRLSALRDSLTGAQNRAGALCAIETEIDAANPQPFGLIFIDLDGFKKINDVYGHAAGDAILQESVSRLRGCLRDIDTVCRLGGDEFVCVIAAPADGMPDIASRLRKALSAPYAFGRDSYVIGCSMGISMYPQHGETAEALLARADDAMYAAKAAGGGIREFSAAR